MISKVSGKNFRFASTMGGRSSFANNTLSDQALLDKYDLKANDAILAEDKHMGLYEELIQNHNAKLIPGGAAQNTARGAQVSVNSGAAYSV